MKNILLISLILISISVQCQTIGTAIKDSVNINGVHYEVKWEKLPLLQLRSSYFDQVLMTIAKMDKKSFYYRQGRSCFELFSSLEKGYNFVYIRPAYLDQLGGKKFFGVVKFEDMLFICSQLYNNTLFQATSDSLIVRYSIPLLKEKDDSLRYVKDNEAGPYCDACLKRWLVRDGNVKIVVDAEIGGLAREKFGLKQRKKKKYYYKTVSFGVQPDAPYVVFKFEKARIFFSREKVLDLFYKEIQEEPLNSRKEKMLIVYDRLKQKGEDVFYVDNIINSKRSNNEVDDCQYLNPILYGLLKKGEAKLYNGDKNCFEKEFKLKLVDCITGERIESFYFSDGTEFCSRYYDYINFNGVKGFLRLF